MLLNYDTAIYFTLYQMMKNLLNAILQISVYCVVKVLKVLCSY